MANICFNTLRVIGNEKEVESLIDDLYFEDEQNPLIGYGRLLYSPKLTLQFYFEDFFDYEECGFGYEAYKSNDIIGFTSNHMPPTSTVNEISKLFPQLEFELKYNADEFVGIYVCKNGVVSDNRNAEPISRLTLELFGKAYLLDKIKSFDDISFT
jgi:hypothetical protein